jgi:thiaminase/transcriptional activator TenA
MGVDVLSGRSVTSARQRCSHPSERDALGYARLAVERFSDELRRAAEPIWRAQEEHPFVRGIADGTLDPARFRHFVRQDYLFLVEYARVHALACARARSLELMGRFAELARSTVSDEMGVHRFFAAEWGIGRAELEGERMAPTTRAYTDFLLRTAALGDFAELVAALLPCVWGYSHLGRRLAELGRPDDHPYARWIDVYAADEFAELAAWCREACDAAAADAGAAARGRMTEAFVTSSRYELAFWEMAWREEEAL